MLGDSACIKYGSNLNFYCRVQLGLLKLAEQLAPKTRGNWRKPIVPSASAVLSVQEENLVYARSPAFSMLKEYGMALYGREIASRLDAFPKIHV